MSMDNEYEMASRDLKELSNEFADASGRPPRLKEVLALIGDALQSNREDLLRDVNGPSVNRLVAISSGNKHPLPAGEESLSDSTDSVYVVASDLVHDISARFTSIGGERPSIAEFCDILAQAISRCPVDSISDVPESGVIQLTAELSKPSRAKPRIGDIVAIPSPSSLPYVASVVARNRFGTAYGFFKDPAQPKRLSSQHHPDVLRHPIYSTEIAIASGRWKIVGHDEQLLSLFPADPEIFHRAGKPQTGTFGAAETASGAMRIIDAQEAEEIGLLNGGYRQTYICEFLENQLPALLKT